MKYVVASLAAFVAAFAAIVAHAQIDAAVAEKWSKVTIVHYEVVGEINDTHVQIPPTDADLYADVFDRVTLSFDWDMKKRDFVGVPTFRNYPGTVSNLMGMEKGCPTGAVVSRTEHFNPAPNPAMLALGGMLPAKSPVKLTPDGKSLILTAQNNNWVWTYTPSVK